jgi:hypothetical protein
MIAFHVTCPVCGKENDMLSAVEESGCPPPVQGDAAICFGCATVLIFDGEPLNLRTPNASEAGIYEDVLIANARMALIEQRAQRGK